MRRTFFHELHKMMGDNPNIYALTADLGYVGFDPIERDFSDRYINVGAAEQCMLDIAVGLALSGKTVFAYSITPFLLWRAAETIRLYLSHEKIPVVLVGSGRDHDYAHDGFSHDATDANEFLNLLELKQHYPDNKEEMVDLLQNVVISNEPCFISLKR